MSDLYLNKYTQEERSTGAIREKGFNFDDPRLMRGAWRNEPNPDLCKVRTLFLREFSYNMFKDCYSYEMMGYRDTLEHEFLLPFMEKFGLR